MIESLGGDAGITPEFRKLENEGLLFADFYATANRSQQAIASLFSGLPGLPLTAITDHPEKYPSVPSLVKILDKEGYFTSFTFGGKLIYGNMKSYLLDNKFDLIVEQEDLEGKYETGKLGVHDEFVFGYFDEQISSQKQPFFSSLFTLSSHSPYDFPGEKHFDESGIEMDFANSVYYSDKELGKFFQKAKAQGYWKNTLFVIMADHSHNTYKNHPVHSFEYHKIPLLITGGALAEEFRGTQNHKLCSNVDVTKTLLKQLGLNTNDFFWSKDILNPYSPEFAYFELNDGFGWKRPYGEQVLRIKDNYYFKQNVSTERNEELDLEGRSYLQVWFSEFMNY
jgi:phosphoglycerol transferase MdoB-like AlkP superfamily enzyme